MIKDVNDVCIILLNYNGYEDTINCIKSIRQYETNVKIIVVDNNSTDKSMLYLNKIKDITLLSNQENLGFAKGNNIGIKQALCNGAKYIYLLNNDTEIEKNTINKMKNKLEQDSSLGIVGSRIMYYNDRTTINYCGGHFNWLKGIVVHENYKKKIDKKIEKFFYTDFITGCSMMIKREVFEKIGFLPEEYFMYFEDADFCLKVREGGYKLGVCSDSIVYHKVSAASGGEESLFSIKWITRNRIIFMNKYKRYTKGIFTSLFFYLTRGIQIVKYDLLNKKNEKKAMIDGIKSGIKYLKNKKN